MKKFLLFFVSLIIISCSTDDADNENIAAITEFTVEQSSSQLVFNYTTESDFEYYEIAYNLSTNTNDPDNSDRFTTLESNTLSKPISELYLFTDNIWLFWIRGIDSNGNTSEWFGPKAVDISSYCEDVYDIDFNGYISWSYYNNETEASYFQIQYGVEGFELGEGDILQTNNQFSSDLSLEQGKSYDAYVRAYCNNNLGFSEWIGPVSYYAEENSNVCLEPYNLSYYTEYNFFGDPVGANISWNDDGNNKTYEFNLVGNNQSPESSAIDTRDDYGTQITYLQLTPNAEYDFYVRTVCIDGSRTSWTGPLNVKIN